MMRSEAAMGNATSPFKTVAYLIFGMILPVFAGGASAQTGVYAYPSAGQSQEEQSRDRFECHQWAVNQTGFDPTTAAPLPAQPTYRQPPPVAQQRNSSGGPLNIGDGGFFEGTGMMGDAATGAALGAAGGAIAGDAGEGAAIGALASTVFGALNRASSNSRPQQDYNSQNDPYLAQEQARVDQLYIERREQNDNYHRAYGACMSARDYTIQ